MGFNLNASGWGSGRQRLPLVFYSIYVFQPQWTSFNEANLVGI